MKIFFKIALITAITALAALSCAPELTGPHNEWWKEYNDQYDGDKYDINASAFIPTFTADLGITADKINTVKIQFPEKADILRQDKPGTAELKEFLSFYTFNPTVTPSLGKATELSELKEWEFYNRFGNDITVKINITFLKATSSNVVVKLDGSKYTYSNGYKLDLDGNGITGETGYDDKYIELDGVSGIDHELSHPVLPGNKGWKIVLADLDGIPSGNTDTSGNVDLILAITADPLPDTDPNYNPDFSFSGNIDMSDEDTIREAVTAGFKLEKFSEGTWSTCANAVHSNHKIVIKDNTFSHMTGYRVVFEKGSLNLETEKEFYDIKQRIKIVGWDDVKDASKEIYNTKKNITKLEGKPGLYYNKDKRAFWDLYDKENPSESRTKLSIYSKNGLNKNVVLRLEIDASDASKGVEEYDNPNPPPLKNRYFFKEIGLDVFKNNFKIYENYGTEKFREIDITAMEFRRETASTDPTYGRNVILITLDPAYKINDAQKHFSVGDGLGYDSGIGVFSSKEIWKDKGFKIYEMSVVESETFRPIF